MGEKKTNLKVQYNNQPLKRSIVRNTIKFLPWQFGHMSTINGIYNGFESTFSLVFLSLSATLSIILVLMVIIRNDNRHLADLFAGSRVVQNGGEVDSIN